MEPNSIIPIDQQNQMFQRCLLCGLHVPVPFCCDSTAIAVGELVGKGCPQYG